MMLEFNQRIYCDGEGKPEEGKAERMARICPGARIVTSETYC